MLQRQLPSLASLQAFEAAARHLSFTLAAQEMHVTQGAVSRRVRQLEEILNVELFHRMTRRIALTSAGHELLAAVDYLLDEFAATVERVGRPKPTESLVLSILPTIGTEWLMPRLHGFHAAEKRADIRVLTSIEPAMFGTGGADAAIRVGRLPGRSYGVGPRIDLKMTADWQGVHADLLLGDRMLPVCSPSLFGRPGGCLAPEEIQGHPLIHTTSRRHAWGDWFRGHGLERPAPDPKALHFGHLFMSLQAAREGRGIALIPDIILAHARMDDLVCPFPSGIVSAGEYFLLLPKEALETPLVCDFREWILAEAATARQTIAETFPQA